jgi:hypothetical protein
MSRLGEGILHARDRVVSWGEGRLLGSGEEKKSSSRASCMQEGSRNQARMSDSVDCSSESDMWVRGEQTANEGQAR